MADEPKPRGPVKDFPPPKKGKKGDPEDFHIGEHHCLRCGATFESRKELDRHARDGHEKKVG